MPVPHHSVFYRPDALPAAQPTAHVKIASRIVSYRTSVNHLFPSEYLPPEITSWLGIGLRVIGFLLKVAVGITGVIWVRLKVIG